jgi:hypothetical protein
MNDNVDDVHVLSIKGFWDQMNPFERIILASKGKNKSVTIKILIDGQKNNEWMNKYFDKSYFVLSNTTKIDQLLYNLQNVS